MPTGPPAGSGPAPSLWVAHGPSGASLGWVEIPSDSSGGAATPSWERTASRDAQKPLDEVPTRTRPCPSLVLACQDSHWLLHRPFALQSPTGMNSGWVLREGNNEICQGYVIFPDVWGACGKHPWRLDPRGLSRRQEPMPNLLWNVTSSRWRFCDWIGLSLNSLTSPHGDVQDTGC